MTRSASMLLRWEIPDGVDGDDLRGAVGGVLAQLEDVLDSEPGVVVIADGLGAVRDDLGLGVELDLLRVEDWPGHLTCSEAESLASVLTAIGAGQLAADLVANHAESDEEGDLHHHDGSGGG